MKINNIVVLWLLLILLISCKTVSKPEKISRLSMLNTKQDAANIEFTAWVKSTAGNEQLGIELTTSEDPNTYPVAIIQLKDGQKDPGKEKQVCIRGVLVKRDEVAGGIIYRIKDAEIIDCY